MRHSPEQVRRLRRSQALPFRLHPMNNDDNRVCSECVKPAKVLLEHDEARGERSPRCMSCVSAFAATCPAGLPSGSNTMYREPRNGCVMRDNIGNRPARFSSRCTDDVTNVLIMQPSNRHYRVRSEPLCARHAQLIDPDEFGDAVMISMLVLIPSRGGKEGV